MNNRNSVNKRLTSIAEKTEHDDSNRNQQSSYNRNYFSNKKTDYSAQPSFIPKMSSGSSSRSVIDAQTLLDVQSNGLAQRIVRYDEESKKAQQNVHNRAYKRTGDFPIVHLQKPKLVLAPNRNIVNSSKIHRIGQLGSSTNRANIRAEILRNGTMMPAISVDRREDVDSVRVDPLDALKEISRKRIHCEDTAINQMQTSPTVEKDSTDSVPSGTTSNNSKRQRIATSPSSDDTRKKTNSQSKCNEILSSLSSSAYMLTAKRSKESPRNSISPPVAKRLQLEKSNETPTIDATIRTAAKPPETIVSAIVESNRTPTEPSRPKLTLFNNAQSRKRASTERDDDIGIQFVTPRPMTQQFKESVDKWLKPKPDDNRRLSLMLKYLSGEVGDSDTVDSVVDSNETPKTVNPPVVEEAVAVSSALKAVSSDATFVTPTIPIENSSTTSTSTLLPTKPSITFGTPLSTTSTSLPAAIVPVSLPATTIAATITVQSNADERKGGFSFPLATKETAPTVPVSSTSPANAPKIISSFPLAAPLAPSLITSSANPIPTNPQQPTSDLNVTFTIHPPKSTLSSSSVVTTVQPTTTFTFGAKESKSTPAFGASTNENAKLTTSGRIEQPTKSTTFGAGFGQTNSIGNVGFGNVIPAITSASTAAPSSTSIFGSMTGVSQSQPLSFGSVSTTQQTITNDKSMQPNNTFTANTPMPVFGSALPNNATTNAMKPIDPRTSNIAPSFTSNQLASATTTPSSFAFGASGNVVSSAFKSTQPTLSSVSSSFGNKPVNTDTNIFGSMASQSQQSSTATSIFGSSNQTPKMESIKSLTQNPTESKTNIFGSVAPKPSTGFTFSATNNQPNANANIFGVQSSTTSGTGTPAFSFSGSNQKPDSSSASKPFGFGNNNAETKSVTFGATKSVGPKFGTSNATDSAKSFGFATINQTSSSNLFNTKSTDELPKTFSFGDSGNATGAKSVPKAFGATATFGGTNATATFGGTNATATFGGTNATATFGGTNATATFGNPTSAFGAPTAAFGSTKNSALTFGGSSTTSTFANAAPSFGGANVAPVFGSNIASTAFGGSFDGNRSNTDESQYFSADSGTPDSANTQFFSVNSGTPSFGTNSNTVGGSGTPAFTVSTGTADMNRTFNFTGNDPAPSPVPNLFNIGPGNPSSSPRGRTIRTATRRTYR